MKSLFKFVFLFGVIGGAIGGTIMGFMMPFLLLLMPFFGIIFGFIPASITGLILYQLNLKKDTPKSYFIMLITGALISLCYAIISSLLDNGIANGIDFADIKDMVIQYTIIGAISAMLTGAILLPHDDTQESP